VPAVFTYLINAAHGFQPHVPLRPGKILIDLNISAVIIAT
jgi:hypothetical protein